MSCFPSRSLRVHVVLAVLACATMQPSPSFAADTAPASADVSARADALVKKAIDALKRDAPAEAENYAREAWALKQSYDIASNLGLAELGLKKHRDAAEHLAYALRFFPSNGKPEHKKLLEISFAKARAEVAAITVRSNVDAAAISVNGARIGLSPLQGPVFVDAGSCTIEAKHEGYTAAKQEVTAEKGGAAEVALTLEREATPVPTVSATATSTAQPPPPRSMLGPAIAFGVGGAGLVMGAIGGGVAAAKFDEIKGVCSPELVCPTSTRGTYDAANTASHLSTAGFIVAGVGAAVGLTLLLLPPKRTAGAQTGVSIGPGFLTVRGSF